MFGRNKKRIAALEARVKELKEDIIQLRFPPHPNGYKITTGSKTNMRHWYVVSAELKKFRFWDDRHINDNLYFYKYTVSDGGKSSLHTQIDGAAFCV